MTAGQQPVNSSSDQLQQPDPTFALQAAGIGTWDLDITNQRVWWDERCKQLYGFDKDDVVPYDQVLSYMHSEDRSQVDTAVQWALNPKSEGYYDVRFRTIGAADGRLRWLHCRGRAFFNNQQIAYRFSGIAQDITELMLTRQEADESELKLQSVLNQAPAAIAISMLVGPDLIVTAPNQTFMDTVGKGNDIAGKSLRTLMPELESQPFLQLFDWIFASGESFHSVAQPVRIVQEGEEKNYFFNVAFSPLRNPQGEIYAILGLSFDVTQQVQDRQTIEDSEERYRLLSEQLEEQVQQRTEELAASNEELVAGNEEYAAINEELEEANSLLVRSNNNLQTFAYVASHDLQEPLRKIQQFGDLLKTRFVESVGGDELVYVERMQIAASRMSTLIKDLLDFSRITTRRNQEGVVQLSVVIEDVLSTLDVTVAETGAQIQVDALPDVLGDATQFRQLFQNLLSNALKFRRSDVPSHIRVTSRVLAADELPPTVKPTRRATDYYLITVADNGIGFDEKYLDRIFQVFQRLHGRSQYAGTGVGLAICEKVVTNHGGVITATSQPNQGATFMIYLPAHI
ncbi:PAS domain-containing sensor histidine kinase [Spirosoma rhododendri]|uniref:histidine kinase n=1 Tax=Spirosoma rhododendri TaxID=2728024 RepID=A0A7L5DU52_9BACT|nr:ATP-binding protein [Spirosoma rhododendri]QJD80843.1 PAS domain S-box protein [Spirosoma rhododendri]